MTKPTISPSQSAIIEANLDQSTFSGYGSARGASGYIDPASDTNSYDHLARRADMLAISPPPEGFSDFKVGCAWDNRHVMDKSFFGKLFKRTHKTNVDMDLGCLFELQDGHVGAIQAFGNLFGALDRPPYMHLSGDDRSGDTEGDDEVITVSGSNWHKIKRMLIYTYIYNGADDFFEVRPQIQVHIPGQKSLLVTLGARHVDTDICAIASLENIRNGIKLTNHTEYFHGHAEMDRAFGFGLHWDDGQKDGCPPPHKSRK